MATAKEQIENFYKKKKAYDTKFNNAKYSILHNNELTIEQKRDAVKKIKNSVIKNLVITDTIDNSEKTKNVKNIEVLPISALMGEAIKRISNSTSVSDLFK